MANSTFPALRFVGLLRTSSRPVVNFGPWGSRSPPSILTARHNATHIKQSNIVYGTPDAIDMDCKATRPSAPPALNRAVAVAPSVRAQNMRWMTGGSASPLAERQSMTREPLSELVTKYRITLIKDITDRNVPRSPYCSITSNHMSFFPLQDKR